MICKGCLAKRIDKSSLLKGQFTLASGKKSGIYVDMSKSLYHRDILTDIARMITNKLSAYNSHKIDAIGGPALGALPLVTACLLPSMFHADIKPRRGFCVRKEEKTYGCKDLIEGNLFMLDNVILLEDVTTSGTSLYKAVEATEKFTGVKVLGLLTVVDREEGAIDFFKEKGYTLDRLFTLTEIKNAESIPCTCGA